MYFAKKDVYLTCPRKIIKTRYFRRVSPSRSREVGVRDSREIRGNKSEWIVLEGMREKECAMGRRLIVYNKSRIINDFVLIESAKFYGHATRIPKYLNS